MSGQDPVPNSQAYEGVRSTNPPFTVKAKRDPSSTFDIKYPVNTIWSNTLTGSTWILGRASAGTAQWNLVGAGATGAVIGITGGTGGQQIPTGGGNFNILGTANQITSTGTANTITLSVPTTFIAPGSITSVTTITAGTGLTVTAGNIVASVGSISAAGTVTAGLGVTATTGNITATNGNLVLNTAGNKIISTSVASTSAAGANAFGKVTLSGGTVTVATTAVTASSLILLTRQTVGATGAAALGQLSVGTIVAGTSFVINAWSAASATALATTDVSNIGWMIIN